MASRVVLNASRIPKADMKAAAILAEMFRSVMDQEEEEELGDDEIAAYSSMLEAEKLEGDHEHAPYAVLDFVDPQSGALVEVDSGDFAENAIPAAPLSRDGDEQFVVNSVDDIRFKSNKPIFSVTWADGTVDWRRFDELAEKEGGELVVNEKLQEFLDRRGLVDADAFYEILKKKKKFKISDFESDVVAEKVSAEEKTVSDAVDAFEADKEIEDLEMKEEEEIAEEAVAAAQVADVEEAAAERIEEAKAEKAEDLTFAAPLASSSLLRKMDAVKAFVEEVAKKNIIKEMIYVAEAMHLSPLQLARVILYQECRNFSRSPYSDISEGPLTYRFVLDALNIAIGAPVGSPIGMSLRGRQNTCSESLSAKTTSKDIPTIGSKFRAGITYAERCAEFLKDKAELLRHLNGIIDRSNLGLTALEEATPLLRQKMLKAVDAYAKEFSETREDVRYAFFGIGRDLDPTLVPYNLGDKARTDIHDISSRIVHKHTSLKDESGAPFPFHGAFWEGQHPLPSGTKLGYYEGRIVTECDNTETHPETQSQYSLEVTKYSILVDATIASESNWARYINDGSYNRADDLTNVRFAKDGSVIATRTINVGDELFVRYGDDYWRFFAPVHKR